MSAKAFQALSASAAASSAAQDRKTENDENDRRKRTLAALIKFGSLTVFALIVLIFATISWFTSNSSTSSDSMGVTIASDPYQIEPLSGIPSIFERYRLDDIKSSDALVWDMTADNNMDNYNSASDIGISPGSHGTVSFYVKPGGESVDLDLSFFINGYEYSSSEDEDTHEVTETMTPVNSELARYLAGHIFLFQNRTTIYYKDTEGHDTARVKSYRYSDPILPDASYERKIERRTFTAADAETPVNIYWVWPKTLSTLVDATANDNVNIEPFCDWQSSTDSTYNDIVQSITDDPTRYFSGYTAGETALTAAVISDDYDTYSAMYDLVDNDIGTNVDFITLKMTTSESADEP